MSPKRTLSFERLRSREGLNRFSGEASFRALLRDQKDILGVLHVAMEKLSSDVEAVDLDFFLHYTVDLDTASDVLRARLRWRMRGVNKRFTFAELEPRIRKLPAPMRSFLEWTEQRSKELNALESVFRSGATMTKTFMESGTVRYYSK